MPGQTSSPDLGRLSPPPLVGDDSVFARLDEADPQTTAARVAIALPREIVLAGRRAPRRLRPNPHHLELPLDAIGRWVRRIALAFPPLSVLAVALWAAAAGFGSLLQVLRLVITLQFAQSAAELARVDAAGRVLLASLGYFVLLAAMRTLARGLLGRGWSRLRLLPGVLLALPSAWLFIAGAELAAAAPPLAEIGSQWWRALVIALTLHTIVLSVVGARPDALGLRGGPVKLAAPRDDDDDQDALDFADLPTEPMPVVRFGPPPEEPLPAPAPEPESDTQVMRVAGLLHILSERDRGERDELLAADAGREHE